MDELVRGDYEKIKNSEFFEEFKDLFEGLKSMDDEVKKESARKIASYGELLLPDLLTFIKYGGKEEIEGAILVFLELGESAINHLLNSLSEDNENVRIAVITALSLILKEKSIRYLINALRDKSHRVRIYAMLALSELGESAIPEIINALNSKNWELRYWTARAIIESGERLIPGILKVVISKNLDGKNIIEVFREMKDVSVRTMVNMIKNFDDNSLQIAEILSQVDDEGEILQKIAKEGDYCEREIAITILSKLGKKDALIHGLKDESWFVRLISVENLPLNRIKSVFHELTRLLDDEKKVIRTAVLSLLKKVRA
jgi:HEAT repeat protein